MNTVDIRWNQNPFLQLSREEVQAHSKEWAFVVLLFEPPKDNSSLEDYLLHKMQWTVECTRCIESQATVESIQQDGQFLTFLFQSPSVAVLSALELLTLQQYQFHIGVGFGLGYLFDHFQSLDLIQMKSILPYGNNIELQISPTLYRSTEIPYGVGAFQCSPALAQISGMNYWILKDYRSELG